MCAVAVGVTVGVGTRVPGDERDRAREPAVGDGDARVGRRRQARGDAGDDLVGDPLRAQPQGLLAAAPEHERIAALQAQHGAPGQGVADHQLLGLLLGHRGAAALLAHEDELGAGAGAVERGGSDEPVVEDHVGAGDQLQRPRGQQPGIAGPGADEVHASAAAAAILSRHRRPSRARHRGAPRRRRPAAAPRPRFPAPPAALPRPRAHRPPRQSRRADRPRPGG